MILDPVMIENLETLIWGILVFLTTAGAVMGLIHFFVRWR